MSTADPNRPKIVRPWELSPQRPTSATATASPPPPTLLPALTSALPPPRAPQTTRRTRHRSTRLLSSHAVALMEDWYQRHVDLPYASTRTVRHLAREGGIQEDQVRKWLANKRTRSGNTSGFLVMRQQRLCQRISRSCRKNAMATPAAEVSMAATKLSDHSLPVSPEAVEAAVQQSQSPPQPDLKTPQPLFKVQLPLSSDHWTLDPEDVKLNRVKTEPTTGYCESSMSSPSSSPHSLPGTYLDHVSSSDGIYSPSGTSPRSETSRSSTSPELYSPHVHQSMTTVPSQAAYLHPLALQYGLPPWPALVNPPQAWPYWPLPYNPLPPAYA